MKKFIALVPAILLFALLVYCFLTFFHAVKVAAEEVTKVEIVEPVRYQPSHRQLVWRHVLEWCESRGDKNAVNPNDLDDTPSYYSFQWKPGTFKGYALKYKILPIEKLDTLEKVMIEMKNYDTQVLILNEMIGDQKKINWKNEFPDCVRKYGHPPSY